MKTLNSWKLWFHRPVILFDYFIAALSVVVIYTVLFFILPDEAFINTSTDFSTHYDVTASNIIQGRGYVDVNGALATRTPPAYPYFIALVYTLSDLIGSNRLNTLLLISSGIFVCSILVTLLLQRNRLTKWILYLIAVLAATNPYALYLLKQPSSEIPYISTLIIIIGIVVRYKSEAQPIWLAAFQGMLLGIGALIRPSSVGLIAVMVIYEAAKNMDLKYKVRAIISIGVIYLCTLVPWQYQLLSSENDNVYISSSLLPSIVNGLTFTKGKTEDGEVLWLPRSVKEIMRKFDERSEDISAKSGGIGIISQIVLSHPVQFIELLFIKSTRVWYATDSMKYEIYTFIYGIFFWGIGVGLYLKTLCDTEYKKKVIAGLGLGILGYHIAFASVVLSIVRYLAPAAIVMLVLLPQITVEKQN